jgi:hypothetical protein
MQLQNVYGPSAYSNGVLIPATSAGNGLFINVFINERVDRGPNSCKSCKLEVIKEIAITRKDYSPAEG